MGVNVNSEALFDRFVSTKKAENFFYDSEMLASGSDVKCSKSLGIDGRSKQIFKSLNCDPDYIEMREACLRGLMREKIALSDELIKMMKRLPQEQMDILFSIYYKGMDVKEIALLKNRSRAYIMKQKECAFKTLDSLRASGDL